MTIADGVAGAACMVAVAAAGAALKISFNYGSIVADVRAIKKMLGNGEPGVFVRREEVKLLLKDADKEHERLWETMHEAQREVRALQHAAVHEHE